MHNICYYTYEEKCNKNKVYAELNEMVEHEDWQEGGSLESIRWLENAPLCENYDKAKEYIESHDKGWYDCLAVRFKSPKGDKKTAKEETLEKSVVEKHKKWQSLANAFHFANVKSATTTCSKCNSRLNISYLRGNYCPLCNTDLRPSSTIERIDSLKVSFDKANKELKDYRNEQTSKNFKIEWLVKIEYHT